MYARRYEIEPSIIKKGERYGEILSESRYIRLDALDGI